MRQSILTECEDDHVGLWSVVRDAEEFFPKRDEASLREEVLSMLYEMLRAGEIKAGFPAPDGRGFRTLRIAPERILARIEADWPVGRRPTIGESLWFTRAKKASHR